MNPHASFQVPDALKPFLNEPEAAQAERRYRLRGYEQVQQSWLRSTRDLFAHCDILLREGQSLQDSVLARYFDWVRGWSGTPTGTRPSAVEEPAAQAAAKPAAPAQQAPVQDDLTRIQGVGKIVQQRLNNVGVVSFQQIATWTDTEIAYIENNVLGNSFSGRVSHDRWQSQAKALLKEA